MGATKTRTYRSDLRAAQARQTRGRVLDAAAAEFAGRGYAGTTLAGIAAAAGVSVETVKLQGAKHELLLAAWHRRLTGGNEVTEAPLIDDDARRSAMDALSDEELLATFVEEAARISRAGSGLWQAFASAARFDAAVAKAYGETLELRRREFRLIVDHLDRRGMIRGDRPRDLLAADLIFLASAEGYQHFVEEQAMSLDDYRAWLRRAIDRLVLAG